MAQLRIDSSAYTELLEQGRFGQGSDTINIAIPSELETDHGKLNFVTTVRVSRKDIAARDNAVDLARDWLLHTIPILFQEGRNIDLFSNTWLDCKGAILSALARDPYKPPSPIDLELSEAQARHVDAALSHLANVRQRFDATKTRINDLAYNNTAYGFNKSLGEAYALLSGIECVLECSGEFYGSQPKHAQTARRDFAELARRQVESNHNYQLALTNLKRFSMLLRCPEQWNRRPPLI